MRRLTSCILIALLLLSVLAGTALAQDPTPTLDPEKVLESAQAAAKRADEVAELALATVEMNDRTVVLIRNIAWAFGIVAGLVALVLMVVGFRTEGGFRKTLEGYQS